MIELDGGGQMLYAPRETAKIAHDWLAGHGVPMKATRQTRRAATVAICPNSQV